MPGSVVTRSTVLDDHYWEITRTLRYQQFWAPGDPTDVDHLQSNWQIRNIVNQNNGLGSLSGSEFPAYQYIDTDTDGLKYFGQITRYQNIHNEPGYCGGFVTMTPPIPDPTWGVLVSVDWLLTGDMTLTADGSYSLGGTFRWTDLSSAKVHWGQVDTLGAYTGVGSGNWIFYDPNQAVIPFVNGHEPFIARMNKLVSDPSYYLNFGQMELAGSERFHLWSDSERAWYPGGGPFPGDHFKPYTIPFLEGAPGDPLKFAIYVTPTKFFSYMDFLNPQVKSDSDTPFEVDQSVHGRVTISKMQLLFRWNYSGVVGGPQNDAASDSVGLDSFDDVVACCWQSKPDPKSGKKQVLIGLHRGIEKNIGTGGGSTAGWDIYNYGDIDQRSPIGFLFLPNGWLFLSFNTYDGSGNATAMYTVNKKHGEKPASNWSAPAALSPNVAQALGVGRNMGQAFRTRIGA